MSFTTVLAQVKSGLEAATSFANVYDYPRYVNNVTDRDTRFVEGTTFVFWFIDRSSAPSTGGISTQILRNHVFDLWHFRGVDDDAASAKTFQAELDTVMEYFNDSTNSKLGGTARILEPVQLIEVLHGVGFPTKDGVMCHRGHVQFTAVEDVSQSC